MPRIRHLLGTTLRTLIGQTRKPNTVPFTAIMTIDQAWHASPGAPEVFARHHLPACDGCSVRFDETIGEAAAAYGIDLDAFLTQLNNTRL
jgi:hybrid cluster-associated redox disulfide protein